MDVIQYRNGFGATNGSGKDCSEEGNDPSLEDIVHSMGKHLLNSNSNGRTRLSDGCQSGGMKGLNSSLNPVKNSRMSNPLLTDSYIGVDDTEDEVSRLMCNGGQTNSPIDISQDHPRLTTPFYEQLRKKYPKAFKRRDSGDDVSSSRSRPSSSLGISAQRVKRGDSPSPQRHFRPSSVINVPPSDIQIHSSRITQQDTNNDSSYLSPSKNETLGISNDLTNRPPSRTEKLLSKLKSSHTRSPFIQELLNRPSSRQSNRCSAIDETNKPDAKPRPMNGLSVMTDLPNHIHWPTDSDLPSSKTQNGNESRTSLKERLRQNQQNFKLLLGDDSSPVRLKMSSNDQDTPKSRESCSSNIVELRKKFAMRSSLRTSKNSVDQRDSRPSSRNGASNRLISPDSQDSAVDMDISRSDFSVSQSVKTDSVTESTPSPKGYHVNASNRDSDVDSGFAQSCSKSKSSRQDSMSSNDYDHEVRKFNTPPSHSRGQHKPLSHQKSGPLKADHNIQLVLSPTTPQSRPSDETSSVKSSLKSGKSRRSASPNRVRFKDDIDDTDPRQGVETVVNNKSSVLDLKYARPLLNGRVTPPNVNGRQSPLVDYTFGQHTKSNRDRTRSIEQEFFEKLRSQSQSPVISMQRKSRIPVIVDKSSPNAEDVKEQHSLRSNAKKDRVRGQKENSPPATLNHSISPPMKSHDHRDTAMDVVRSKSKSPSIFNKRKGSYNPSQVEETHTQNKQKVESRNIQNKRTNSPRETKTGIPVRKGSQSPVIKRALQINDNEKQTSAPSANISGNKQGVTNIDITSATEDTTSNRTSIDITDSVSPSSLSSTKSTPRSPERKTNSKGSRTIHIPAPEAFEDSPKDRSNDNRKDSINSSEKTYVEIECSPGLKSSVSAHGHNDSYEDDIAPYQTVDMTSPRSTRQRPCSVPADYSYADKGSPEDNELYAIVNKGKSHKGNKYLWERPQSTNPCVATRFDDSIHELDDTPPVPRRAYKSASVSNLQASKELSTSKTSLKERVDSFKQSAKDKFSSLKRAISLDRLDGKKKSTSEIKEPKMKKSSSLRSLKLSFKKKEDRSGHYAPDGFLHSGKESKLRRSKSSASNTSLASVEDVDAPRNFRAIGKLLALNPDASQVIELVKPPHGPFGFYIARGNAQFNHGIFVSRLSDGHPEKFFAGLLGLGDEILEINGVPTQNLTLDEIYDNMASTTRLVLKTLPLLARNDMV